MRLRVYRAQLRPGFVQKPGMVPGVCNRLLLRAHSCHLDPITRNPKRFQQVRVKVRITNTASARTVAPNETIPVPTNQMDMLINLALEVGKGGHLIVERDVLTDRPKA